MTFQDFLEKWNGKYCEVAGSSAQNQCVDLANCYIRDVLGLPIIEWTNAKDFPSKAGDKYEWILNTPTNVPQEGDLIIWGGTYGHIAIFVEGDVNSFRSLDQNYPLGSFCHIQNHTYSSTLLGWLRYKGIVASSVQVEAKVFENLVRKSTIYDKVCSKLNKEDSETVILGELDRLIGYEDKVREQEKQLAEVKNQVIQYEAEAKSRQQQLEDLREKVLILSKEVQVATEENLALSKSLQELKEQSTVQSKKNLLDLILDLFRK